MTSNLEIFNRLLAAGRNALHLCTSLAGKLFLALFVLSGTLAHAQERMVNVVGANNKYMVAEGDQVTVNVNRPSAGPWEQWAVQQQGNTVVFKSTWGKFLSAQPDGSMQANRPAAAEWERFQMVDAGGGMVAFQTAHKKYLVTTPNAQLAGTSAQIGNAEKFKIVTLGGAQPVGVATAPAADVVSLPAVDEPTEFYWKGSYGRGVGTPLDACPAGKSQRGALCYDNCRSGYSDNGTLTCSTNCPSGYTDMGAICHYNGSTSYSPVREDSCAWRTAKLPWDPAGVGNKCQSGLVEDACRDGYRKVASMCYLNLSVPPGMSGSALDPTKGTYNLSPESMVCGGGKQKDGSLCYPACRAGYNGVGPVCWAASAPGYVDCGMGTARNEQTCATVIIGQVTSVLSLVKDVCSISSLPGVSQACTQGAKAANSAKASAKMGFKSVAEMLTPAALTKVSAQSKKMMEAAEKAAPEVANLTSAFAPAVNGLAGKGASALPEFGASLAKMADSFKDPATVQKLVGIASYMRSAAGSPPFKLSGTPTEQAFKAIRDIAASYEFALTVYSLVTPGFEETPTGKAMAASSNVLSVVAAYLYTTPGQ